MSEYTEIALLCDNCYPDFLPSFTFFRLEAIRGVFRGVYDDAVLEGWEQRDFGHICPECVKAEAETSADGEVVLGGAAVAAVFQGASDEDVSS